MANAHIQGSQAATRLKDALARRLAALGVPIELELDMAVDDSKFGGGRGRGKRGRVRVCVLSAQLTCETSAGCVLSRADLEFRWFLRLVETVSGDDDRSCSEKPRTV